MNNKIYAKARFAYNNKPLNWWAENNPILENGEPAIVSDTDSDEWLKIGDGVTAWNDLPWKKGPRGEQGENGETGDSGVYIGSEEPTDEDVIVWVDPDGEADILSVNVKETESGHEVSISTPNSRKSFEILNGKDGAKGDKGDKGDQGEQGIQGEKGADGYTPVKGVDYFTEADQEEIVQQVIAALGTPIFGTVDADNKIILTGELTDGTYAIKYENAEGNVVEIGELVIGAEEEIIYNAVYGKPTRVGDDDYSVYFEDIYAESTSTNYKMLYQTTGEISLYSDADMTIATNYYPIKVPTGKTKVTIAFPNLDSDKSVAMALFCMSLADGIYTRTESITWQTLGVYSYTFSGNPEYIIPFFRNDSYGGLDSYNLNGATVVWE